MPARGETIADQQRVLSSRAAEVGARRHRHHVGELSDGSFTRTRVRGKAASSGAHAVCAPAARHNAGARRGAGRQHADASTRRAPAGAGQEPVSRRGRDRPGSRMSGPPHLDSCRRAEPGEQPRYPPKESETSAASGPVCTSSETSAGRRPSRDVGPLPGRAPACGSLACARPPRRAAPGRPEDAGWPSASRLSPRQCARCRLSPSRMPPLHPPDLAATVGVSP